MKINKSNKIRADRYNRVLQLSQMSDVEASAR